jgi:aldehyde dehydrogenase (NAD+)
MYIDGKWVDAEAGAVHPLPNPATEELFAEVPDAGVADMQRAIAAARRCFERGAWRDRSVAERSQVLEALADGLESRREELSEILIGAHGCEQVSFGVNLDDPIAFLRRYAEAARCFPVDAPVLPHIGVAPAVGLSTVVSGMTHRHPVGVCGLIPTWNFPLFISVNKIAPALAMGCSVVVKPSPWGPLPDLLMAEILDACELPFGVYNVVTGARPELGEALVESSDVDMIGFTGSAGGGRRIMSAAGATLKRLHLELGGKSALIVLDDAEPQDVIGEAALAAYFRAGQACALKTRVLVPRSMQTALVEAMESFISSSVKVGDPCDPSVLLGPLIRPERVDAVLSLVESGRAEGARLVTGGGRPEHLARGWFVEPTLFADVSPGMRIAQEEIFGPVVSVIPYEDDADAIRIANASEYGLSGSIYTRETGRAIRMAKQIRTGQICINGVRSGAGDDRRGVRVVHGAPVDFLEQLTHLGPLTP